MNFKEILSEDVKGTFLNLSEFADTHRLNGKEVAAMVDDDLLDGEINVKFHGQAQQRGTGLYNGGVVLYVSSSEFGKPKPGSILELDRRRYEVISASEQEGMRKIDLKRVGGL